MAQANPFKTAKRAEIPLRVLLIGLSGSGKTYTALALACHMAQELGEKVAVIDTENGSASKYAGEPCRCETCRGHGIRFEFDVLELNTHSPKAYMDAMVAARTHGYRILVEDSISHEWEGKGGCLEMVDAAKSKNKHAAWGPVTKAHNSFLQAIRDYDGHVVTTCRAKEKHENRGGEIVSRGVLPIQREGIEYEFDFSLFLSGGNASMVKTRAASLDGWLGEHAGGTLSDRLLTWSAGNEDEEVQAQVEESRARSKIEAEILEVATGLRARKKAQQRVFEARGDMDKLRELLERLRELEAEAKAKAEQKQPEADQQGADDGQESPAAGSSPPADPPPPEPDPDWVAQKEAAYRTAAKGKGLSDADVEAELARCAGNPKAIERAIEVLATGGNPAAVEA